MSHILTINAGSSSLKVGLYRQTAAGLELLMRGLVEGLGRKPHLKLTTPDGAIIAETTSDDPATMPDPPAALARVLDVVTARWPGLVLAGIGHRVVHGGTHYSAPVVLTDAIMAELAEFEPLAPLHQPHNLSGLRAAAQVFPNVPQVACFDTAFHRTHPWVADVFALPRELYDAGVRRYGFHGLSYEFVSAQLGRIAPEVHKGRVIIAHLGSGASMCGLENGRSVASTMGFSALDGLPMGTRCGQIDPGVLLWLMQSRGMDAGAISDMLYKNSGLKGLSGGISGDMRDLEASVEPEAAQAVDYFVWRVRREIGGLAALLSGIDGIVFTGGIGENAVSIRARVLEQMQWFGIELDPARNAAGAGEIGKPGARVRVFVIPTDEEATIAGHTARLTA